MNNNQQKHIFKHGNDEQLDIMMKIKKPIRVCIQQ